MNKPSFIAFGGAGTVTGSNFLFEVADKKYLIDCGLLQGVTGAESANGSVFEYDIKSIEALFITHAHADHIGRIPKLVQAGFRSPIYSTQATKAIAEVMLTDLAHIEGLKASLIEESMKLWRELPYRTPQKFDGFTLEVYDSGHILGSGMYRFSFPSGKSILFTGDLGNTPSPLLKATEEVAGLTYLLMESVYGDRNHDKPEVRDKRFADLVLESAKKGRTLVIPVFSLERTQLILFELHKLYEEGKLKDETVFLDSPLAIRLTKLYESLTGKDVFRFPMLHETPEAHDSMAIAGNAGAKIILAGSGMSTAGRILFHEERYLPDPNATILFIGYQAPGTLGRQIQEGVKEVIINENKVPVRAKIANINGYSAHADSDQLVDFVSHSKDTLKKIFIAMGEPKSSIFLAQRLHDELGLASEIVQKGKRYELEL